MTVKHNKIVVFDGHNKY